MQNNALIPLSVINNMSSSAFIVIPRSKVLDTHYKNLKPELVKCKDAKGKVQSFHNWDNGFDPDYADETITEYYVCEDCGLRSRRIFTLDYPKVGHRIGEKVYDTEEEDK